MFQRLRSVPKNYEWGTRDAISRFTGAPATGLPEAELWFGTHALADCAVVTGNGSSSFDAWLGENDHEFPLLVKFLAASMPLSIQVHPGETQAKEGFARENAEGIALDAPKRTYKDPYPKPELLVALSDSFDALWGLLTKDQRGERLTRWGSTGLAPRTVAGLGALGETEALSVALSGDNQVSEWANDLTTWALRAGSNGEAQHEVEFSVFHSVAENFPGDRGIVVAALMHCVRLTRGQAIFVRPGDIHAYVDGFGLEVMLPSDNVVRGGLSSKHQDPELFIATATAPATALVPLVEPVLGIGSAAYSSPDMPFRLTKVGEGAEVVPRRGALIVGEQGSVSVSEGDAEHEVLRGEVYFVSAEGAPLKIRGGGTAWLVEGSLS